MNSFESKTRKQSKANKACQHYCWTSQSTEDQSVFPGNVDPVVAQQSVNNPDKFSGSQYECSFTFGFRCLIVFTGIETLQFGVVLPNLACRFYKITTQVTVSGMDHMGLFGFEIAGLMA